MKTTEYLVFLHVGSSPSGKTEIHYVKSRSSGIVLGEIRWYGAWRQYCFYPAPDTIFNRGCLSDINDHIAELMEARK